MIDVDLTKSAEQMSDDELKTLVRLAELMKDAEQEQERRRIESDPNRSVASIGQIHSTITTHAFCPSCGRNDAVSMTKTMYSTPDLAYGGEPIGAALCKCGGGWYNAGTGEHIDSTKMYSY